MNLTIHGYSTALFATWYFIEELGILFDAGDGLVSNLMGKCGKIKHVFISHPDRDHLTGLLQYNQIYAGQSPTIYYPKEAKSFQFLETFSKNFDPHVAGTYWIPLEAHQETRVKDKISVEPIINEHVFTPNGEIKSFSYKIWETKKKLKPDFLSCSSTELRNLRQEKGEAALFEEQKSVVLAYSGDTPVTDYERFHKTKILIHEATFLTKEETETKNHKNRHSSLEEVMQMVASIEIEQLVLGHFSSRYEHQQIVDAIKKWIAYYQIKIPVFIVPVGRTRRNILNGESVN
ncbi:RNAse Z [Flavobacterium columnare]|nr:RNAse Z [Flavobacterium columnare]